MSMSYTCSSALGSFRLFPGSEDEKVDVFGAGAVLYFALSNTLPFPGKTLKKAGQGEA